MIQGQLPESESGTYDIVGMVSGLPILHSVAEKSPVSTVLKDSPVSFFKPSLYRATFNIEVLLIQKRLKGRSEKGQSNNPFPQRLRVSAQSSSVPIPGQVIRFSTRLKTPRGFVNPGGFDYQRWLLQQGIGAIGYVVPKASSEAGSSKAVTAEPVMPLFWSDFSFEEGAAQDSRNSLKTSSVQWVFLHCLSRVDRWRFEWRQRLVERSGEAIHLADMLGPILALSIGDRSYLSEGQWEVLQRTGLVHLLAISGLHIGLAAGLGLIIGRVAQRTLSLLPVMVLRSVLAYKATPALFSIVCALAYALLAGFTVPTQRALIMVVVANVMWMRGGFHRPWMGFWLAAAIVLMIDPLAGHSSGFWMSFLVVVILIGASQGRINLQHQSSFLVRRLGRPLSLLVIAQLYITGLMLLPSSLLGVPQSGISPVANLLAIPVVSLFFVPAVLGAMSLAMLFPSSDWGIDFIGVVANGMSVPWPVIEWLSSTPLSEPIVLATGFAWLGWWLIVLTVPLIFLPPGLRLLKCLGVILLIFSVKGFEKKPPLLKMTVMDVGQGLSVVIQVHNQVLLYDSGPAYSESFTAAEGIVGPYLRREGITSLNHVIISHGDLDHAGGLPELRAMVDVQQFSSGEPKRLSVESGHCWAGQVWQWGEVKIRVLWPLKDNSWGHSSSSLSDKMLRKLATPLKSNDQSCVLELRYKTTRVWIPGDISKAVEWFLVAAYLSEELSEEEDESKVGDGLDEGGKIEQSVLVAPHHGSNTSSSHRLLSAFAPTHVVFSSGYRNRYGHPSMKVIERYHEQPVPPELFTTATEGAIEFEWNAQGTMTVKRARDAHRRFWYQK
ncbi:DNA internalization-related competence protein ComEC/Rec2 [Marinibactrum halimedae]|uniref:DNA internalization-related competence protein ComEC/Rec2 n=2 Tax=Marinibactrum halimedae TaxID=1444977 RepID=A0AA37WPP9_9GAMM|nr:DNA internalization-related competence protein ComEC/Rec2 [Marinibactrum halimedae]